MTRTPTYDRLPEQDPAFVAAFNYLLRRRGWSVQEFCRRTEALSADGQMRLIHPNNVTKWRRDRSPGGRAIRIACETLGVPRSLFFVVGEALVKLEEEGVGEPSSAAVLLEVDRALPELREQVIRILLDG